MDLPAVKSSSNALPYPCAPPSPGSDACLRLLMLLLLLHLAGTTVIVRQGTSGGLQPDGSQDLPASTITDTQGAWKRAGV